MTTTASPMTATSEGRPRFAVIVITAGGSLFKLREIDSIETQKSDNGDAGTWNFRAPLALNALVAAAIAPMDLVALYAYRNSVDLTGQVSGPDFDPMPELSAAQNALPYGALDAHTTKRLASGTAYTPTCLMIGMVDAVDEEYDFEGPGFMLAVNGRDLTKIFIDNDTIVPETLQVADTQGFIGNIIVRNKSSSGTVLLNEILDTFVAKDPASIRAVANTTVISDKQIADVAKYGYPWRNFIDASKLLAGFKHIDGGELPTYSVQSGSAWANVAELRNFPITRLFVDEIGRLIFDDAWTAWGFGTSPYVVQDPPQAIDNADVRKVSFRQADDTVLTALSLSNAYQQGGNTALSGLVEFGQQRTSPPRLIARYGYRYNRFVSNYDGIASFITTPSGATTTDVTKSALDTKIPLLWQWVNDIWTVTFTLKGNAKWRVGQRVTTTIGGAQAWTQPLPGLVKFWYVTEVANSMTFGSDWTTTITARFARNPVLAANVVGGNSAPL